MFESDVAAVEDPVQGLRERLARRWPARTGRGGRRRRLSELVVELAGVVERAEAELLRVVGEWDAVGAWELEGAATPGELAGGADPADAARRGGAGA